MGQGDKPVISGEIVKKTNKEVRRRVLSAWVSDKGGLSATFDKDVEAIKFKDGVVARIEDVWFNMKDWRDSQPRRAANTNTENRQPTEPIDPGEDDIPF